MLKADQMLLLIRARILKRLKLLARLLAEILALFLVLLQNPLCLHGPLASLTLGAMVILPPRHRPIPQINPFKTSIATAPSAIPRRNRCPSVILLSRFFMVILPSLTFVEV